MRLGGWLVVAVLGGLGCGAEMGTPEIVVTTIATFGDTSGDGAISGTPTIARDGRGRYYAVLAPGPRAERVAVFDSTGKFLTRLGAFGDGPGEYRQPNVVVAAGDSVWIFDLGSRRLNFIGPDLAWMGSMPTPGNVLSAAALPHGNFLVNWPLPRGDSAAGFLQRYDLTGKLVKAYDEPRAPCQPEMCFWYGPLVYSSDRSGAVWAARMLGGLEISRYDSAGRLLRRLALEAPWFPRREHGGPYPIEMMTGIMPDSAGRVWLAGMTVDPEAPADSVRPDVGDADRLDGILEVRDSLTGAVIATRRFDDAPLLLPIGNGLVAHLGSNPDGWARVEIWRVAIEETGR